MVELDPHQRQVVTNLFDHQLQPALREFCGRILAALQPAVACFILELLGHVDHIGALVAAFGQRDLASELLLIASEQGAAEEPDLRAGVIDVVLALDLKSGGVEHRGQRIAEDCAASVADLQRAGRVGRDELDLHPMAFAQIDAAPLVARVDHGEQQIALPLGVQRDIDESRPGHIDIGDWLRAHDAVGNRRRHVHRRHPYGAGQPQGDVAGVVAVFALLRPFYSQLDWWNRRQRLVGLGQFQGIADQFAHQIPRRARHVEFTLSLARLTL